MPKSLRKYVLIIVLVFLLPTLFFSVYEIGTLRENEKVIEEIYNNQLDAILFSINQYSEDVVSNWADLVESCLKMSESEQGNCVNAQLTEFPSVSALYLYKRDKGQLIRYGAAAMNDISAEALQQVLEAKDTTFTQLATYLAEGYRKIASLSHLGDKLLLAYTLKQDEDIFYVIFIQDPEKFVTEVLDPRIQQVAQERFNIAVIHNKSDAVIYTSDRTQPDTRISHRSKFWLMPEYSMGIELRDSTISELVRSRSKKNLLLIGLIDIILFLGIGLIYRNIKKQIELSQLKSDFVSNVSHEIRTPLALITMYIETLEMGRVQSAEKIREYYRVIQQETQRLTAIVNKILNFSQIESGKRSYHLEKTNLNDLVREMINSYSIRLDKDGFSYTMHLDPDLPEIEADKEAVTDALINLVDNAMKYSDQEKHIELETSHKGNFITLSVLDKGIGISEHDQKHVFDKFYRVTEKDLALKAKGSGLGLPIVKHIMDAHQGTVTLESKKGKGTRFTLNFPC